ncbi:MAG TPA: allene oxide cyclase family protein [Solirubrobacterales bacterium]
MKVRYLIPIAAVCAGGLLTACGDDSDSQTIKVVEHADTDVVRHIGPASEKDSVGDVLAFANPVFDSANEKQVGTDNGQCVRTAVGKAWECIWTVSLSGGQLTVEGPFYDAKDSTLAITGGTDDYKDASGQMALHARDAEGTEYDFTYEIEK